MQFTISAGLEQMHEIIDRSLEEWIDLSYQLYSVLRIQEIPVIVEHGPREISRFKSSRAEIMLVQGCNQVVPRYPSYRGGIIPPLGRYVVYQCAD
jgi:hypothetical protein